MGNRADGLRKTRLRAARPLPARASWISRGLDPMRRNESKTTRIVGGSDGQDRGQALSGGYPIIELGEEVGGSDSHLGNRGPSRHSLRHRYAGATAVAGAGQRFGQGSPGVR